MSAGSWVHELRPTVPVDELVPACLPETWNRTVERIGLEPALWAVELSREHALVAVEPDLRGVRRTEAALRLQPTTESVNMRALVALADGLVTPTTPTPEMVRQIAAAVRRRVPLEHVLELAHASHAHFGEALIDQFRRLVPADEQAQGLSQLSRFLVDHVSAFSLACNTAYVAEEQAWLASADGARGEVVRALLRGETPEHDMSRALRYEIANRTHIGLVLRREVPGDTGQGTVEHIATELLTRMGVTGHLVVPGDDEVWAWGAFTDSAAAGRARIADVSNMLIAVGSALPGLGGFRVTHDEAAAAARLAVLAPDGVDRNRTVRYDDVRLLALLVADPPRAVRFARTELGALAGVRDAALRTTVRVYLECNCSPAGAAARLHVAKNTVVYRIQRAEELLGRSVKEQQGRLWTALHLTEHVDLQKLSESA